MAKYALLGGRSPEYRCDFSLEEKIFQFLSIRPKKILFIPFANPNLEDAIYKFKALVPKTYTVQYLTSLEETEEDIFQECDVIYFAGGSAERLVAMVKQSNLLNLLLKYQDSQKLFIGISAGAILFSIAGMGDQYSYKNGNHFYNYQMVQGLGILPLTICPHYDHDGLECYNRVVREYPYDGFALEDDTAILIHSHIFPFKMDSSKSVYQFFREESYLMRPLYEKSNCTLAVLGPEGTYSDQARTLLSKSYPVAYYPSIYMVCEQASLKEDIFIPLENTLDGFVMESLDSLIKYDLHIIEQVKLAVDFQFVSLENNIKEIQEVYVQFKAYGQCQDFILQHKLKPIFTQSNMESLACVLKKEKAFVGAIVPIHTNTDKFPTVIKHILGNVKDETRFVLASKNLLPLGYEEEYTCSLIVTPKEDKPGVLFSILKRFHDQGFNLKAILSRPKKDRMGNYIFYLEFNLKRTEFAKLRSIKKELEEHQALVKILGIYNSI